MKKLLIVLMVIAMASFLFVGCLPAVTPDIDEDEDEDEDVAVQTDTPYITATGFSILSTSTQYITAIGTISVDGVGVAGAIIKLYVDDVYVGIGTTGTGGAFTGIAVTGATVTEGVKVLHVTATTPGLAESDASTAYTFTYDKTAPTIVSVVGDSSSSYITVTFSEAVKATTVVASTWKYSSNVSTYVAVDKTVSAISTPTTTTARLTEVDANLFTGYLLAVQSSATAVTDLAGNAMIIPVIVFGTVVPQLNNVRAK